MPYKKHTFPVSLGFGRGGGDGALPPLLLRLDPLALVLALDGVLGAPLLRGLGSPAALGGRALLLEVFDALLTKKNKTKTCPTWHHAKHKSTDIAERVEQGRLDRAEAKLIKQYPYLVPTDCCYYGGP